MTYEEARAFIDDTARYGAVLGLDSVPELMRRLGNPQDELKFVHIAGTNGKGSTLAYISTILKEAGYRVGPVSYTHLRATSRAMVKIRLKKNSLGRLASLSVSVMVAHISSICSAVMISLEFGT